MADMFETFAPDVDLNAEPPAESVAAPEPAAPEVTIDVKEPEPKTEEQKPEEAKPQKLVPLEALHESRIKEREWRDKAAAVEKDAQERFQKLEARLEKLVNPPPAVPDFATDPAANLQHQVAETKAELAAVRQASDASRKIQEAQAFEQQIASATQSSEAAFSKDHPDYLAAVQHLQAIADKNMEMMGITDPAARQAQIRQDALAMSLKALQMGKSPAEVAYQLAANYGYKAGSEQAPNAAAAAEAAKKVAALQAGQKATGMPAGGTKQTTLTLAALESMDDDDFNKLVEDDKAWSKLVKQMS